MAADEERGREELATARAWGARGGRALTAALGLLAASLGSVDADAAPPAGASSLGWVRHPGAETCIGSRALAEAVEARLGRPVFGSAAQADLAIEGRIEREPGGAWRAVIAVAGADEVALGTRELRSEAPSCHALDAELALVIAVMLDPQADLRPAPAPAPAVVARPALIAIPYRLPPPAEPWRGGLQAGAVFSLGLLPGPGVGLSVRGRLTPPRWPAIELGGALWLPGQAATGSRGTRLALVEGLVALCPLRTSASGFDLGACAEIRIGQIRSGGFGFNLSFDQERPTVAPSLEGQLRRRLVGPLVAGLGLGLLVPIVRDRFYYGVSGGQKLEVFRMSLLAGTLEATLGVELP